MRYEVFMCWQKGTIDSLLLSRIHITDMPPPKHETFNSCKIKFMQQKFLLLIGSIVIITILASGSCNKPPYYLPYKNVKGFVIGSETCTGNPDDEYWLVDLTFRANTPQYGDTLLLNGATYTNVVKTKGLRDLKAVGKRVSIDFDTITSTKIETTGCTVSNPVTYKLKEIFVINLFEML